MSKMTSTPSNLEREHALAYMLAGQATITIERPGGGHFTYKIEQKIKKTKTGKEIARHDFWFVSLLTGSDNTADYRYVGYITKSRNGRHFFNLGRKPRASDKAASVKTLRWALITLDTGSDGGPFYYHDGACGRCGLPLTHPESLRTGLGPVCAGKA